MKRPNFKDFLPKDITAKEIQEMFKTNEHLYNYIQALDTYIDELLNKEHKNPQKTKDIEGLIEQVEILFNYYNKDEEVHLHKGHFGSIIWINTTKGYIENIKKCFLSSTEKQISSSTQKIIEQLEKERDDWKKECQMYINAWSRELGEIYQKTHTIDALVITTRALKKKLKAFEEVSKTDFR